MHPATSQGIGAWICKVDDTEGGSKYLLPQLLDLRQSVITTN
jgi:hypothetical protein